MFGGNQMIVRLLESSHDTVTKPPGDDRGASESTESVCRERLHVITYQGTQHAIPESQWPAFLAGLKRTFRTQVLRPLESRMSLAGGLYESMRELNNDQWAVAWVLEAVRTGINLDEVEAPITRGREALRALQTVAEGDDLAATEAATRDAEQKINAAYAAIQEYRALQIRAGEATVTALEITQTACFTIFAIAGGAVLAAPVAAGGLGLGAVSSGAIMGGGTALLSSAAAVGGRAVAGEEVGWADLRHVTLDTIAGAAGGALGAGVATRITPHLAPALTRSLIANGLFHEVPEAILAHAVNGAVAGAAGGVVQGAVMDGVRVLDRRATFEQLLHNVVINLIAGGIAGLIGSRLSSEPTAPTQDNPPGSPRQLPAGEPTTVPPERQLGPGRQPTARERLDARRAAQAEQSRATEINEGISRVDQELAAGTHRRRISQDDIDWLNADTRRKAIAYDPDIGTYRVSEARQAIAGEEAGVLSRPVTRSTQPGTDLLDGAGTAWSVKGIGPSSTVESTVDLIAGEAAAGRPCLGDLRGMSMREQAAVRTMVTDQLVGHPHAEIRFLPVGVERIPGR